MKQTPMVRLDSAPQDRSGLASRLVWVAVIALWVHGWGGNLVLTLQFGRFFDESVRTIVPSSTLSTAVDDLSILVPLLALASVIGISFSKARTVPIEGLLAIIAPWLVLYPIFLVVRDMRFAARDVLFPLFIISIYLVRPKIRQVGALVAHLIVITAVTSVAMGLAANSIALMPSWWNADKSLIGGSILAGPYGHSNQLGTVLALGVPFVITTYRGKVRSFALLVVMLALVWSSSRSSVLSVCVFLALVAFALSGAVPRGQRNPNLLVGATLAATAAAVYLPLFTTDPTAYTYRGKVWQACLEYWSHSVWVGGGADVLHVRNDLTRSIGAIVNHSNNVWLTFATTGGILALASAVVAATIITLRATAMYRSGELLPLLFILMLGLLSIAEDPVRALHLGPQSFVVWTGLALIFCDSNQKPEEARSALLRVV